MNPIIIRENGLAAAIGLDEKERPRLLYFGLEQSLPAVLPKADFSHQLVLLQASQPAGRYYVPMGVKQHATLPGADLRLSEVRESRNTQGRVVDFLLEHEGLKVTLHWQFFDGLPVVRSWLEIVNQSSEPVGLEQATSFVYLGLGADSQGDWSEHSEVTLCHHAWCAELEFRTRTLREMGLVKARENTSNRVRIGNTGSWSTKEYLPIGCYRNTESGSGIFWQIESSGSWSWEIGDLDHQLYLMLQGPCEASDHWFRTLQPGESFTTVPVMVGAVQGGVPEALARMNAYRRRIRRPHWDNVELPVIFNDYMNCLFADPTTEREMPYIQAAKEAEAELYVIDAGWYAQRGVSWWTSVGEWQPSTDRFEGGIKAILQTIREHGMIPGLWLELEVMGVDCPLAKTWPKECFFRRHGKPIILRGRYQLDYRHPVVRSHADEVIDRLVNDYRVGYIKMDYNIDAGIGTEVDAESFGDGLLQHNRAYLAWLRAVFARHPRLIIENCSSGGLRMDYALLAEHSLQSISDQENVFKMARIAACAAGGATPEQQAVWVYPKACDSRETVIMNCINGMLARIHLSGQLAELCQEHRDLIREAIALYKTYRQTLARAEPVWPLGFPRYDDTLIAAGFLMNKELILAVWNLGSEDKAILRVPLTGVTTIADAEVAFPNDGSSAARMAAPDVIQINHIPAHGARLIRVQWR
ncbi:MAG: alpha-galactosidase [Verrucomicrobiota bacterium]|nr:alpha-galactosidase [Verrucomicrobiota bacterium]